MRTFGSQELLAFVRRLAVERFLEGDDPEEIAEFLGVSVRSVWRWIAAFRAGGWRALAPAPVAGRPPRLLAAEEQDTLALVRRSPQDFGFWDTRWTAPRLAEVMAAELGVTFQPQYLFRWLARRGITPQLPAPTPREKDPAVIAHWLRVLWPRIKKTLSTAVPRWFSWMNRAF